jgi:hypothetical protein
MQARTLQRLASARVVQTRRFSNDSKSSWIEIGDLPFVGYTALAIGCGLYGANTAITEHSKEDLPIRVMLPPFAFVGGLVFGPPYLVLAAATWPMRAMR